MKYYSQLSTQSSNSFTLKEILIIIEPSFLLRKENERLSSRYQISGRQEFKPGCACLLDAQTLSMIPDSLEDR